MSTPAAALEAIWLAAGLPGEALAHARLIGGDPVFPSSFAVGTAAQASIAAAALAACEVRHARGFPRQHVCVAMDHAAVECTGWFAIDGRTPPSWDPFSGLYRCADGWVRVHANFRHHREGAMRLLGVDPATATREACEAAMLRWNAIDYETASADAGLAAAALRTFDEWDVLPQAAVLRAQPLVRIERIGEAPPLAWPALAPGARPLEGLRVLDLTRILAGPVGGKALAAYGADVMLVNSPHLPNIDAISDTSRGKRSVHVDLRDAQGRATLEELVRGAHVFVQGYRPGAIAGLGWAPGDVARLRPGITCVSLSAYGGEGPWGARRGFDSLVQTATGFNDAEGRAAGSDVPRALPMQVLDEATGYLIAFGTAAALRRQRLEGGSWHVQVSLARTGQWLRSLGRVARGFDARAPERAPWLETTASGFGALTAITHSAGLADTPARYVRPSQPPGTDEPRWD